MQNVLIDFELGSYKNLVIEASDETGYINGLVDAVIANSRYVFDDEAVDCESVRIAADLKQGLEEAGKPLGAFCYLNGIEEGELTQYCKSELKRGQVEDAVIRGIAANERIEVEAVDLALCRQNYAEEYSRALLDGMGPDEDLAKKAMLAKKVLQYLMSVNEWKRHEG